MGQYSWVARARAAIVLPLALSTAVALGDPLTIQLGDDAREYRITGLVPPAAGAAFGEIRLRRGLFSFTQTVRVPAARWAEVTAALSRLEAGALVFGDNVTATYTRTADWEATMQTQGRPIGTPEGPLRLRVDGTGALVGASIGIHGRLYDRAFFDVRFGEIGSQLFLPDEAIRPGGRQLVIPDGSELPSVAELTVVEVNRDRVRAVFTAHLNDLEAGRRTSLEVMELHVSRLRYVSVADRVRGELAGALAPLVGGESGVIREMFFPGPLNVFSFIENPTFIALASGVPRVEYRFPSGARSRQATLATLAGPPRRQVVGLDCSGPLSLLPPGTTPTFGDN